MRERPLRIVIVGAGVAGSLIAGGLGRRDDVEVICLEKAVSANHSDSGTGLNIGPNGIKALRSAMPEVAETIVANAYPWRRWTIGLADGRELFDLDLLDVADNPGVRIRWSELYALLRSPVGPAITYSAELSRCGRDERGLFAVYADGSGVARTLHGVDLLISADGRYSHVRRHFFGEDEQNFLGVCLYRILFAVDDDCPIDDYGQWFNGPNRLLAFRVPGNLVYCAGSFTLPADGAIRDEMKTPEMLRGYYTPLNGKLSRQCGFLVDAIVGHADRIHWARLQEGSVRYNGEPGVLLVGDSAHPMTPTLGQGATQAVEDACVVVDEVRKALATGESLASVADRVDARRRERVQFVVDFSRDATDTMLPGADPIAGTMRKLEPLFQDRLKRLYRDTPRASA
jgi:2-polyprenyl-6-methoxyphenol hydroxylase-like FAD-dependent oxidoreductase